MIIWQVSSPGITLHSHATYANADLVQEMRERRIPEEMK